MFILNMEKMCSSVMLYNVLAIVKRSLSLIQLVAPIFAIIALVVSFVKLTVNPDQIEVYKKRIMNTVIALVIIFFIPSIINLIMALPSIEDNTTLGACWSHIK